MISIDIDAHVLRSAAIAAAKDGGLAVVKIECSGDHCELCATDSYVAVLFESVEPNPMPVFCGCLDAVALRNGLKTTSNKALIEIDDGEAVVTVYDKRMRLSCRFVASVCGAERYPDVRRVLQVSDNACHNPQSAIMGLDKLEHLVKIAKAAFVKPQLDIYADSRSLYTRVVDGAWKMSAVGAQVRRG